MPASLVMSVNFAIGISARGRSGDTGAANWVICGGGGAGLRLRKKTAPPNKTAMMTKHNERPANGLADDRVVNVGKFFLFLGRSGGLVIHAESEPSPNSGAPGRCNG